MKKSVLALLFIAFGMATSVLPSSASAQFSSQKIQAAVSGVMARSDAHAVLMLQAQDEASAYAFSDGTLRGPTFNKALEVIRAESPRVLATDMDLAIAILQAN